MPAVSAEAFDASVRHAVLLERLKAGQTRKILAFLREMDREVRSRLSGDELTGVQRGRLELLLADIGAAIETILQRATRRLTADLRDISAAEAAFQARALTEAVQNPRWEAALPAPQQIHAAVFAAPLAARGAAGGKLLDAFLRDFTQTQVDAVTGVIRRGVFEGKTNAELVREIRGTRALRYSDGILATTKRQAEAVVRTAVQHVSHVARLETMAANATAVKQYEWVSTLDNRTSEICQSLSGQRFPVGEGPVPPAHVNCRSTIVPVLDERFAFLREGATQSSQFGPVDAKLTYFEWLKRQPAPFQDAVIGPTRGKLLRNGGLSAKRFAELQLSRNFQPLTLAEMQRLEPLAFQRANIELSPDTGRVIGK